MGMLLTDTVSDYLNAIGTQAADIERWVLIVRAKPRQVAPAGMDQVAVLAPPAGSYTEPSAERTGKGTGFRIAQQGGYPAGALAPGVQRRRGCPRLSAHSGLAAPDGIGCVLLQGPPSVHGGAGLVHPVAGRRRSNGHDAELPAGAAAPVLPSVSAHSLRVRGLL